jgi:hypothetical protein
VKSHPGKIQEVGGAIKANGFAYDTASLLERPKDQIITVIFVEKFAIQLLWFSLTIKDFTPMIPDR